MKIVALGRSKLPAVLTSLVALMLVLSFGSTSPGLYSPARAASGYDWTQFNGDPQHSGDNTQETVLTSANVAGLATAFRTTLPAIADDAPAYLTGASTASGTRDLLFVTTETGDIIALDAHTGVQIWIQHNPAGTCRVNNRGAACYTTASPAIDPNRASVYSYGLDGMVHKYAVGTGAETIGGGWPEPATLKDYDEKGSSALSTAMAPDGTSYLYVTNSAYPTDGGDYQGHVTAINLNTGAQNVFNSLCSNQTVHFVEKPGAPDCAQRQSGIWARPGVIYDSQTNRIYLVTGNAAFSPTAFDWGDTVFALNPDGTGSAGSPVDSYTPTNFQALNTNDLDLGSTAPAILQLPPNSPLGHLAVQGGKDSILRVLNLDNLSGQGGPGHTGGEVSTTTLVQGNEILTQPATWVNPADGSAWIFVATNSGISALDLVVNGSGSPVLQTVWESSTGGSSPIIANNVLYYATNTAIRAIDPLTGTQLWQGSIASVHWESPIIANGMLYVTDGASRLTAFGLPGAPTPTPTPRPRPDLKVTAISTPPTLIGAGGSFSITDTTTNSGAGSAGLSTTGYYLSPNPKTNPKDVVLNGSRSVPALGPSQGSSGSVTVTVPSTTVAGTYYLVACADSLNAVKEGNEANNCTASTTRVLVEALAASQSSGRAETH